MTARVYGPITDLCIEGSAVALPPRRLSTEAALASVVAGQRMDAERRAYVAEQLDAMLGTASRHWSYTPGDPTPHGPHTAQLATQALGAALERAGCGAEALDMVLVATSTPHRYTGTVASAVSEALGVHAPCVDVRAGCSSGLFALGQAALALSAGAARVAIVGADTFSAVVPPSHRLGVSVMADGAAALILKRGGSTTLDAWTFETDGAHAHLVSTPGPMPPSADALREGLYLLDGQLDALDALVPERYAQAIQAVLARAGRGPEAIDWFVPHQTTLPSLQKVCEGVGIAPERLWSRGIAAHGNIGAAGWMAALSGALERGDVRPGHRVLSASVGGGMSWGAALWTL